MKKYKNKVTQAVIETAGVIKGGNWELVEEVQPTESTQKLDAKKEVVDQQESDKSEEHIEAEEKGADEKSVQEPMEESGKDTGVKNEAADKLDAVKEIKNVPEAKTTEQNTSKKAPAQKKASQKKASQKKSGES